MFEPTAQTGHDLVAGERLFRGHPLHRRVEVELDGLRLHVRPVLPGDTGRIARFVQGLSSTTAYRRFLAPTPRLTARALATLVDVDHHDRETLLALTADGPSSRLIGVGQYVRLTEARAEIALVVGDAWQRRGVGRMLAAQLAQAAAEEGIAELTATVLAENPAPQRLAVGLTAAVEAVHAGTTVDLTIRCPTMATPRQV
jgi:GNAT superfamily N-acetyltransferase